MTTEQAARNLKGHIERGIEWKEDDLKERVERFIEGVNRIDTENIMHGSWQIAGLHSEVQTIEDERNHIREDYARLSAVNRILEDYE